MSNRTQSQTHIAKDTAVYKSPDGYIEYDFAEIRIIHNPASFAGIRFEQVELDKNNKSTTKKINLSHAQVKKLKRILRDLYPRD
jgi:hypothetical protein